MKNIFPFILLLLFSSCEIGKQKKDFEILADCKFGLEEISSFNLAGVAMENILDGGKFDFHQFPNLVMGLMTNDVPIDANIVLSVYNPSGEDVELSAFDYIILVDDIQIAGGKMSDRTTILPETETYIPLSVKGNAYQAISSNQQKWIDLLSGNSETSILLQIKVKPNVNIVGTEVKMPGYLTFEKEINAELLKKHL